MSAKFKSRTVSDTHLSISAICKSDDGTMPAFLPYRSRARSRLPAVFSQAHRTSNRGLVAGGALGAADGAIEASGGFGDAAGDGDGVLNRYGVM